METTQFETRLKELSSMVGSDRTDTLFNQEYEQLLSEVKALPGPRYEMLARMRKVMDHQLQFAMIRYLRASHVEGMN